ncbi:MAG: protein-L-isoaspartate(D-aspartate) O-methyltransferase [Kiritimatiellaeota bacterium]|nr:protein-L-isoaspartate(D-aspartate) O-methyltransferase [Kiritimatiellota bacterium]
MKTILMMGTIMVLGIGHTSCSDKRDVKNGEDVWSRERGEMMAVLRRHQVRDERILQAMAKIRRHVFIPTAFRRHNEAYGDHPVPIGHGQTISQPYIVAYMTEKLALQPGETVLEVGTGSGYQAAVLAELGARVYSIEIVPELAQHARAILAQEGYAAAVQVLTGDGYRGWPEHAPFDAIIVTCAPTDVPPALVAQLKEGGRFILPVGAWLSQRLVILRKVQGRIEQANDLPVQFVPMVKGP